MIKTQRIILTSHHHIELEAAQTVGQVCDHLCRVQQVGKEDN